MFLFTGLYEFDGALFVKNIFVKPLNWLYNVV